MVRGDVPGKEHLAQGPSILNPNSEIERPRSAPTRSQVGKKPEVFYLDTEPEV
jgi:hypothetical protein